MSRLSCEIPDALSRKLARAAKQRRVTKAAIVCEGLTKVLAREMVQKGPEKPDAPVVSAYDVMKGLCGIFDSGLGDLSTNKKHMEHFGRDKFRS